MKKIGFLFVILLILILSITSVAYAGQLTPTETPPPVTKTPPPDETPTPPPDVHECSPGFWKQPHHFQYWVGIDPDDAYDSEMTYLEALQGGKNTRLSRFIVAGILNANNPDAPCE